MRLTKADKLLAGFLIALSLLGIGAGIGLYAGSGRQQAQISVDGQVIKTVTLRPGYREEIRLGGSEHYNLIEIDGTSVRIRESDCPDQVCVKTGWVNTAPQQIVCLPWRVVVKISSAGQTDIDDIAH